MRVRCPWWRSHGSVIESWSENWRRTYGDDEEAVCKN